MSQIFWSCHVLAPIVTGEFKLNTLNNVICENEDKSAT